MREILFRGKAINRDKGYHLTEYKNGEWVYGLVTKLYDEQFKSLPAEMTNTNGIRGIEIDYKTIGRYTGLTDKNGNKIFEGDILKLILESKESDIPIIVKYGQYIDADSVDDSKYLGWYLDIKNKCVSILLGENDGIEFEVAGNIYDNPELLEE